MVPPVQYWTQSTLMCVRQVICTRVSEEFDPFIFVSGKVPLEKKKKQQLSKHMSNMCDRPTLKGQLLLGWKRPPVRHEGKIKQNAFMTVLRRTERAGFQTCSRTSGAVHTTNSGYLAAVQWHNIWESSACSLQHKADEVGRPLACRLHSERTLLISISSNWIKSKSFDDFSQRRVYEAHFGSVFQQWKEKSRTFASLLNECALRHAAV